MRVCLVSCKFEFINQFREGGWVVWVKLQWGVELQKHGCKQESHLDVFGDGLGSLRNGVSGQLSGEDELDGRLDFPGGESSSLVEADELGSLSGDSVEGIVDEGVHDVHGLLGDTDVGVHLLEDLVDVDGEGLNSSSSGLSVDSGLGLGLGWFLSHFNQFCTYQPIPSSFLRDFIWENPAINLIGYKKTKNVLRTNLHKNDCFLPLTDSGTFLFKFHLAPSFCFQTGLIPNQLEIRNQRSFEAMSLRYGFGCSIWIQLRYKVDFENLGVFPFFSNITV